MNGRKPISPTEGGATMTDETDRRAATVGTSPAAAACRCRSAVHSRNQRRRRWFVRHLQSRPGLRTALRQIARTKHILVGCDYDGTLSPIVANPSEARLYRRRCQFFATASLPDTTVAIISGRAFRDLAAMSRLPIEIDPVGSHGAEFDLGSITGLGDDSVNRLSEVTGRLCAHTEGREGTQLEVKPSGVAVHVRRASREDAGRCARRTPRTVRPRRHRAHHHR